MQISKKHTKNYSGSLSMKKLRSLLGNFHYFLSFLISEALLSQFFIISLCGTLLFLYLTDYILEEIETEGCLVVFLE